MAKSHGHFALLVCDSRSDVADYAERLHTAVTRVGLRRFNPLTVVRLAAICVRCRIDVAIALSSKAHWYCLPLAMLGVRLVRSINVTKPIARGVSSLLLRYGCNAILACAKQTRQHLFVEYQIPEEKIRVIPSGVELKRFTNLPEQATARRAIGLREEAPMILNVAMLRADKGHRILLEAAIRIVRARPDAIFVLAGGEPQASTGKLLCRLKVRIRENAMEKNFLFLGYREDIPELLAACDFLVIASLSNEASPIVLREAFAAGKPVISTAVGDAAEVICPGETGFVVSPGDADQLAGAISRVLRDAELRRRCAQRAKKEAAKFSFERMITEKLAFFQGS